MKTMVLTEFGGPESFKPQERDRPAPGANEVLVKVHATSVNPADAGVRSGDVRGDGAAPAGARLRRGGHR